jgi:hypothetical protein
VAGVTSNDLKLTNSAQKSYLVGGIHAVFGELLSSCILGIINNKKERNVEGLNCGLATAHGME